MINGSKAHLDAITGLRFFAALAVFCEHYLLLDKWYRDTPQWILATREAGLAGVALFFVLSGFILAYMYEGMDETAEQRLKFWSSRVGRIYPVYFLGLIWFGPFIVGHRFATDLPHEAILKTLVSFLPSVALMQSWTHPKFAIAWNGPGWTLSVEVVFYLIFPFVIGALRRLSSKAQILFAIGLWGVSVALPEVLIKAAGSLGEGLAFHHPIAHIPTFLIGVLLGLHFCKNREKISRFASFFTIPSLLLTFVLAAESFHFPKSEVQDSLFLPTFGCLIYGLGLGGWPAKFLGRPFVMLLGESSYALYILQFPLTYTLSFILSGFKFKDYLVASQPYGGVGYFATELLFCTAVSIAVFKFIESPARPWFRRKVVNVLRYVARKNVVVEEVGVVQ